MLNITKHPTFPTVTLTDVDGKILYQGTCYSYTLTSDPNNPCLSHVNIQAYITTDKSNNNIKNNLSNITTAAHIHKWKEYQGLSEKFEYCEICNEKKT